MTLLEALKLGKSFIDSPEKLAKGAAARNKEGKSVSLFQEDAVSFCSLGAMGRADPTESILYDKMSDALQKIVGSVLHFNDSNTWEQVMAAWNKAIEIEENKSTTVG